MDKIVIRELRIYAYHGVNPEEKIQGQYFVFDIDCFLNLEKPCRTDNVDDTVSYASVIKAVRRVFTADKNDLLEKCAQQVADAVLEEFPVIEKIRVLLKKPDAPVKADFGYVGVEIVRERVV